ncbi:hypothetical protein NUACC26_099860 [Scytonema sp. NUACC26]
MKQVSKFEQVLECVETLSIAEQKAAVEAISSLRALQ